jgi:hypothetical protein
VNEYNEKQKRNDRKIDDYYEHIANGKREEAFYEIVVQFGDSKIAPVGSDNGELAKKLLDEYIKSFEKRNPNLKVFNAVLHMDEANLCYGHKMYNRNNRSETVILNHVNPFSYFNSACSTVICNL